MSDDGAPDRPIGLEQMVRLPVECLGVTRSERPAASLVAAPAVAIRIADFLVRTEQERQALFQLHLKSAVDRIPSLLLDLAELERISLPATISLMRPPQQWPWLPLAISQVGLSLRHRMARGWPVLNPTIDASRFARAFGNPGIVVRDVLHPLGRFGIRPNGRVLGFTAAIGPCLVSSFGSLTALRLPEALPETLMTAMPGRQLDRLIDHPVLRGKDYRVIRVETDPRDGMPVIMFRVPLVHFATLPVENDGEAPEALS